MFRFHIHLPDNWLLGISRYQVELEDEHVYEAISLGLIIVSIEYIWESDKENDNFGVC